MASNDTLPCWIYRSEKKQEMYLYLAKEDAFESVPQSLMQLFGPPTPVMRLELSPQRRLAREDVTQVMGNLNSQGFHLQMPPLVPHEKADA